MSTTEPDSSRVLSNLWFAYFAAMGLFFPFFSLFLSEVVGLPSDQAGWILATLPLVGIFAQPFWGQVSDRTGRRRVVLASLGLAAGIGFFALGEVRAFWSAWLVTVFLALSITAIVPLMTALSFAALSGDRVRFGRVRTWGTVGFAFSVLAVFLWGSWSGAGEGELPRPRFLFGGMTIASLAMAFFARRLPKTGATAIRTEAGSWKTLLVSNDFIRLLVFGFLAYLFMQGPVQMFAWKFKELGGGARELSLTWLGMLAVEIPLIFIVGKLAARLGVRGLLRLGMIAEGIRWIGTGLCSDLRMVQLFQLLHGVGVIGVLVGIPLYLDAFAPRDLRSTAQAVVTMVAHGLGTTVSAALFAQIFNRWGAEVPFVLFGAAALMLGLSTRILLSPGHSSDLRTKV